MNTPRLVRDILIRLDYRSMLGEQIQGKRKYTIEYICAFLGRKYFLKHNTIYMIVTQEDEVSSLMQDCLLHLYRIDAVRDLKANVPDKSISFVHEGVKHQIQYPSDQIKTIEDLKKLLNHETEA